MDNEYNSFKSLGTDDFEEPRLIDDRMPSLYIRTDREGNADESGEYILFGLYPKSRVTDKALLCELNIALGALPRRGDEGAWLSTKYYIENNYQDDYIWYQDVDYKRQRYRAVCLCELKDPCISVDEYVARDNPSPDEYKSGGIYWFKFEPIIWQIYDERGNKAYIISDMCIDSREFSSDDWDSSYEKSSIRAWLNEELLNTAFSEAEREIISLERVDNSLRSTADKVNRFICADTVDFITLLSAKEAKSIDAEDRIKAPTDYAVFSGIWTSPVTGNGWWWLRSPCRLYEGGVHSIKYDGGFYDYDTTETCGGVCPALWIRL